MSAHEAAEDYDVIVIGTGPVGQTIAERVRSAGLTVAAVERELVGGECSYWACVPSKAMLRPVTALADARRVGGAREAVTGAADAAAVLARRDTWVTGWDDRGQAQFLKDIGADLIRGHARLDGTRRVSVEIPGGSTIPLTARHAVVVCTGSRPNFPELANLADVRPWTNREGTDSRTVPERLAIIGGGGVGVEMATAWHGLGSSVTLLAQAEGLLPKMEPFVGEMIARAYTEAGIDVRIGVTVEGMRRPDPTGPVTLSLEGGEELEADEVLLAIGRRPLTYDIGLQTVGLEPGSWLEVDDTCAVRAVPGDRWLYALGDVNGRAILTHQGKYQARVAGAVIAARAVGRPVDPAPWGPHAATADSHAVPQVFFCDPQAGAVGLTADQAERAGHRIRVVDVDTGEKVAGAGLYADGYTGRARMVVDEEQGRLLGVTMVGPAIEELVHSATVAVAAQVPVSRLWHAVPCFPSISEVWLRLLEAYRDATDGRRDR
ncbi:dihydrolipoyl dehydrogenase family protein [Actinomadura madurae]|uniref:dihydrolipoyl dehydrogenase family protein n=1 Tax=Actinomadura madurae TaxID=1993 RepID=UPI000D90923D|nr:NAD(P)/FAD-dependent oxidoreductase [Actinomadura madurae]SPT60132.1 Dihydrolipoyl dehydrogenase [Actinomadura madurae]